MRSTSQTAARTLDALGRHFGLTDVQLAAMAGGDYSRATIQARRIGRTGITAYDAERFAEAFGIPSYVLMMPPVDALRWVLDNVEGGGIPETSERQARRHHGRSDLRIQPSPCMREPAGHRPTISPLVVPLPSAA